MARCSACIDGNKYAIQMQMDGSAQFGGDKCVIDAVNGQLNVKCADGTGSAVVIRDSGNSLISTIDQVGSASFSNSLRSAYVWVNDSICSNHFLPFRRRRNNNAALNGTLKITVMLPLQIPSSRWNP